MELPSLPDSEELELKVFRNIYTIKTSQDLFDDLVDEDQWPVLNSWENATSQIDHSLSPTEGNFQYGNYRNTLFVFDQVNWIPGRFSDGSFGVWSGARDKHTSIMETLYWSYKHAKEDIAISTRPVVIDRKMFEADCKSPRAVDLSTDASLAPQLTSEDYTFCQSLGAHASRSGIGMFLTPSARNPGGICTPIFDPKVILGDKMLYFCHFTFFPDGRTQITTDEDRYVEIPASWKT